MEWIEQFVAFELTKSQKQVILLGMGDKEITPNDIFTALNNSNTETEKFTKEVTVLRKLGLLESFRTNVQASNLAFKDKKDVPRYKVKLP